MAHEQQRAFCNRVKSIYPDFFKGKLVLDIGSHDINGNNGELFENCLYIGVDLGPEKNVDFVSLGHEFHLPNSSVDVIISTECFEHDMHYQKTLMNIIRMLRPGGLFLFTCATTGRPEHGTRRSIPEWAPLLNDVSEWGDYYKNLTEDDIRFVLEIDSVFSTYEFQVEESVFDLYFFGIKQGKYLCRNDYSFLLNEADMRGKINYLESTLEFLEKEAAKAQVVVSQRDEHIKCYEETLASRDAALAEARIVVSQRDEHIKYYEETLASRDAALAEARIVVSQRDDELDEIKSSRLWRFVKLLSNK